MPLLQGNVGWSPICYNLTMRIIGIDPGFEKTGFAVMETENRKIKLLDFGMIFTSKECPFPQRLHQIATDLKKILKQWKPQAAAIEHVFFSKNVKTAIKVANSRGVVLEILEEHGIPIHEFTPSQIKSTVTGDGKADKLQIKKMLQYLLSIDLKNDDTADAIAAGLCLLTTNS